jgi:hypothetical protein
VSASERPGRAAERLLSAVSGKLEQNTSVWSGFLLASLEQVLSPVLFDIRYSTRKFVRSPGLALALLLTIALGIGSNVSVHGFVRGLTRPGSPLTSIDRVVSIFGLDAHREAGPL